jgi:hypothetical protein
VAVWLSVVYHLIRMARSLRPELPDRPRRYYNPANAIFYPADLTLRGQRYRDRAILSILLLLALSWFGVVLAALGWLSA